MDRLLAGPGMEGTLGLTGFWGKHEQEPGASGTRLPPPTHSRAGLEGKVLAAIVTWWREGIPPSQEQIVCSPKQNGGSLVRTPRPFRNLVW